MSIHGAAVLKEELRWVLSTGVPTLGRARGPGTTPTRGGDNSDDAAWKSAAPELLPDFLQGWYLLVDSGLDSQEKNMIQTAVNGDFSVERVAQELRTQWPDDELRRRDQGGRHAGYWARSTEEDQGMSEEEETSWTAGDLRADGMTSEGIALVAEAAEEAEAALAAMEQARRTLREARAKQHQVKMSRKYYKVPEGRDRDNQKPRDKTIKCFRCGGPHKIAECPEKKPPSQHYAKEEAPFVCYGETIGGYAEAEDEALVVHHESGRKTTDEAILKGYGIIDGGATRTLGSVHALKAIAAENIKKYKNDGIIEVDPSERPVFGFGNSSQDQCVSTASMRLMAGQKDGILKVHTLNKGTGPVLLSIATLRSLGAVIDFAEDLIVFRSLDPSVAIQAERSQSGHQLLPLMEDLFKNGIRCTQPVPSLREFCQG